MVKGMRCDPNRAPNKVIRLTCLAARVRQTKEKDWLIRLGSEGIEELRKFNIRHIVGVFSEYILIATLEPPYFVGFV